MLTELRATNFKSWPEIGPMKLGPLTGLFGANSSGKTSVLQLLLMLKQTVESTDRAAVLELGDERSLANLGSFRDLIYRHEKPGKLEFSIRWRPRKPLSIPDPEKKKGVLFQGEDVVFQAAITENGSEKLVVDRLSYCLGRDLFVMRRKAESSAKYELESQSDSAFRFVRTQGRPWDLPSPVKCYGFPAQVYAYFQNAGFLGLLQLSFEEMMNSVSYLGPLRDSPRRHYTWTGSEPGDMGRRGERVVDALLASRERGEYISRGRGRKKFTLEEQVAYWLKKLGLIHEFSVQKIAEDSKLYRVAVRKSRGAAQVLIPDVGFGVSQVLPVLVLCYYVPEGSIILLEQPEIHLHPSVQSGLADVLIDAMRNRNVQIILESHSEHLLRRLQRRIAEGTLKPEETALYFCNVSESGSTMTKLDVDLVGSIRNWPKDFFGDEFGEMAAITEAAMKRRQAHSA